VSGFYAIHSEIECQIILKMLEEKGYQICLPSIEQKTMKFYTWRTTDKLIPAAFGTSIPDPSSSIIVIPDVLLVPLLAFDQDCYRIGYGGGYYDKYISYLKQT